MLDDVPGHLYDIEGEELARLTVGKTVLEVGCFRARSTIFMAREARRVVTVDWFQGDSMAGKAFTWPDAYENVKKYDLVHKVVFVASEYKAGLESLDLSQFDLAFYDAGHGYEETADALKTFLARLPARATVVVHDYKLGEKMWEPTVQAVDEYAAASGRSIRKVGSLAILEPVA